jgi:hypothetical protein
LVVAQSSSEAPEGLMNNPVYVCVCGGGPNYADNILKTENFLLIFSPIVRIKQSA